MTLDPVVPGWLLIALVAVGLAAAGWRIATAAGARGTWIRRLGLVLVAGVIVAQPMIGTHPNRVDRSNLDVFVAVDTTPSVAAEDYAGHQTRLTGIKAELTGLAGDLADAQLSLVTFDDTTQQRVPLTTDTQAFVTAVSVLAPEGSIDSGGSVLSEPVPALAKLLAADAKANPARQRVLVLVSDGEPTSNDRVRSFRPLARYLSGGAVLGYGTAAGAPMRGYSPLDGAYGGYIRDDDTGAVGRSKLDETTLRAAAAQLGVPYQHRTSAAHPASALALPKVTYTMAAGESGAATARSVYWIAALALGVLLLGELWHQLRAAGLSRRRFA